MLLLLVNIILALSTRHQVPIGVVIHSDQIETAWVSVSVVIVDVVRVCDGVVVFLDVDGE